MMLPAIDLNPINSEKIITVIVKNDNDFIQRLKNRGCPEEDIPRLFHTREFELKHIKKNNVKNIFWLEKNEYLKDVVDFLNIAMK